MTGMMIALFVFFLLLEVLFTTLPALAASHPNIVFILTDDQAAWTLGSLGNRQAYTPNLDGFFDQSVVLRNCFVTTPVCSPSRACLMTSRYGSELGITDWINPKVEPHTGLDPSITTWPEVLQRNGYETCLIGKWHLGTDERFHPRHHGFDHFKGFLEGGVVVENPTLMIEDATREFTGFTDDILTGFAVDLIAGSSNAKPYLLCLHLRAPHAPWLPAQETDSLHYKGMDPIIPNPAFPGLDIEIVKRRTREYLTSVTSVDRNVGRILGALEHSGKKQDTVVIFTSDNGYNMGHNGIWHKGNGHWITLEARDLKGDDPRLQRPNMYDQSLRVPAAIRWTGRLPEKTSISNAINFLDWFPTLLALAGIPPATDESIRGRNFMPLLEGKPVEWDETMYGEYYQHHYTTADLQMYRTPEWKLIMDRKNPGKDELYHLSEDPGETRNLIQEPSVQTTREELLKKLEARTPLSK
jgi:choline-sulfatase